MSVFEEVVADLFSEPNLAVDAYYRPVAGAPVLIRVVLSRPDIETGLMQTGTLAPTSIAEIQTSQIATVEEGAELEIGAERFVIRNAKRDIGRLMWHCQLRKV